MIKSSKLFENQTIWDQDIQQGQVNLAKAIIDFFPDNVTSALDIGCGDGKLTSSIIEATKCPIVGFDSSQEALSRCDFRTIHGDATELPFKNNEFDLVLTTDMLEHLLEKDEDEVWQQLFRVAKHWVMVAVPFREELLDGMAKCGNCRRTYHVNGHMRSYDWPALVARCPDFYEIDSIVLTGESWGPNHELETKFRREILDQWGGWSEAVCLHCGFRGSNPSPMEPLSTSIAPALGNLIYSERLKKQDFRSHSEILVIYRRKNTTRELKDNLRNSGNLIGLKVNELIFDETIIEDNLLPYPAAARAVRSVDQGIIIQFPAYSSYNYLEIKTTEHASNFELSLEDGLGLVLSERLSIKPNTSHYISLQRELAPSYYGILLRIDSESSIKSIQLGDTHLFSMISNPTGSLYSYYTTIVNQIPVYIQVTSPLFFDSSVLTKNNFIKPDWSNLFRQIKLLIQIQLDELQASNEDLILQLDRLRTQNQDLILERDNLRDQNFTLINEVKVLNKHIKFCTIKKILNSFKKLRGLS